MSQSRSSMPNPFREVCFAHSNKTEANSRSTSYIRNVYYKICRANATEPDENGESFISRLKKERSEIGKKEPYRKPITDAEKHFLVHDCVFISAVRGQENGGTDESNENNTKLLRQDLQILKEQGLLTFYDSEGDYKEINSDEIQHEKGFFCTDVGPQVAAKFFNELFKLSEYYSQDSFLFKSAGGRLTRTGYLIATNEAAINDEEFKGGFKKAGELYFNLPAEEDWSESDSAFGDKRVFFRCDKPSKEDLAGSLHPDGH